MVADASDLGHCARCLFQMPDHASRRCIERAGLEDGANYLRSVAFEGRFTTQERGVSASGYPFELVVIVLALLIRSDLTISSTISSARGLGGLSRKWKY